MARRDPESLHRWERRTMWPLAGATLAFLAAYAWPVLQPDLGRGPRVLAAAVVTGTWVLFAIDYVVRLRLAPDRRRWFRTHLLDLAALLAPVLRPLQLVRLVSLLQVLNRTAAASLRGRVGAYIAGGSLLVGFVAAVAVLQAERGAPGARITDFGDALWWASATMTTVGYGDIYPVTGAGRLIAVALMISGIALLGAVTATLASWFVEAVSDDAETETESDLAALRAEVGRLTEAVERLGRDRS